MQMLRLVPGHVDPTVNMHDWLLMYRGDRVQDMYRIGGRGAGC
jgi:D-serine deaminase-like pyridoxal phosphate-dependent protein